MEQLKQITIAIVLIGLPTIALYIALTQFHMPKQQTGIDIRKERLSYVIAYRYNVKFPEDTLLAHTFISAGEHSNVDPILLLAIAATESSVNWHATSPDGSTGYMGVQPKYWKKYDVTQQYLNIYAGADILNLYATELNSMDDAIVAYNIGLTAFHKKKHLDRGHIYRKKVLKEYEALSRLLTAPTTHL